MNKKTLTKLEYHKINDILIEQATSFGGKERCKRLKPMTSITDIEAAQEQTAAAFTRIIKKGRPSFGSCNPVGESLKRLEVGAALGSGELLRICKLLENAGQIVSKEQILEKVWDLDGQFVDENTVPVNISRLKSKIGNDYIRNVRGLGYIWTEESLKE